MMGKIVLASGSRARFEVLQKAGFDVKILVPGIDEENSGMSSPRDKVLVLACMKAAHVMENHADEIGDLPLLAADTLGDLDGATIKKPRDRADAFRILSSLWGRSHNVITGFSLHYKGRVHNDIAVTKVFMRSYSDQEINFYLDSGEYVNKAGAYAIQGMGALLVDRIEGCYFNVMGLPLSKVWDALVKMGYSGTV